MVEMPHVPTAVAVIGLIIIWTLETWWPFILERRGRLRHALRNLTLGVLNALVMGIILAPLVFAITAWAERSNFGLLRAVGLPPLLSTAVALLLLDGWMYLWHRASHQNRLLWRFHRTHHSDTELDVTSTVRFHTGEIILSAALRLCLIPLLGISLWQVFLYDALLLPVIEFHHSNINLPERWDRALRFLIASPAMHRVHHSRLRTERDSNYSSLFSWWDRLFGTFCERPSRRQINFGLDRFDVDECQRFSGLLCTPLSDSQARG